MMNELVKSMVVLTKNLPFGKRSHFGRVSEIII